MAGPKCLKCHERPATVKLIRIINGKVASVYLCERCAAERSPLTQPPGFQQAIERMLDMLVQKQELPEAVEPPAAAEVRCPVCGMTLAAFKNSLFLGCARCYSVFGGQLEEELRRLHGSIRHVGRSPEGVHSPMYDIEAAVASLKKQLVEAIEEENFLKAAELRDRLRHLKGELYVVPEVPEM